MSPPMQEALTAGYTSTDTKRAAWHAYLRTTWQATGTDKSVTAPVSLIISAFAPVQDVRNTLTPELDTELADSVIVADHLATVLPREIDKVIGHCNCMPEVETALKRVLGL